MLQVASDFWWIAQSWSDTKYEVLCTWNSDSSQRRTCARKHLKLDPWWVKVYIIEGSGRSRNVLDQLEVTIHVIVSLLRQKPELCSIATFSDNRGRSLTLSSSLASSPSEP